MARAYSGREFSLILGIADNDAGSSLGAVGADTQDANAVTGSKVLMRVDSPINDFDFSAGYQRAEIARAGSRTLRAEDIVNHYGSGMWTYDFDYLVDNEKAIQNLVELMYPKHSDTITTSITYPAAPTVSDYGHGENAGTESKCAFLILQNPDTSEDRYMHSAILQNLDLSMDAGTDGGRLRASGQFMTGYKPVIEANTVTADTSASDYDKGLFDCTTTTFAGAACTVRSFSLSISNPANRIGFQGSSGETDGYVRGGAFGITGSITIKIDSTTGEYLRSKWQTNTTCAISVGNGSSIDFSIPAANISGWNMDMADEGVFVEIPFTATSGADAGGNLAVLKFT